MNYRMRRCCCRGLEKWKLLVSYLYHAIGSWAKDFIVFCRRAFAYLWGQSFCMRPIEVDVPVLVRDVFVPGGFPKYTYQERAAYGIEGKLKDALDRLNKFIAVAGPTKSGKTVLVQKMVPEEKSIWIEGGHVNAVDDLWAHVLSDLHVPAQSVESNSYQVENSKSLDVDSSFKPGGIGASLKGQELDKTVDNRGSSSTFANISGRTAIKNLLVSRKILVIDDFHYLDSTIQSEIIRALKPAVFRGLRVVLILIPHRMHQAAQAEMDVDGRTHTIPIPDWQPNELFSIAYSGFERLRIGHSAQTLDALVNECFGSPHLMQDFCSNLCSKNGMTSQYLGDKPFPVVTIPEPYLDFFKEFAGGISPEAFRLLRKGPERTNRKDRELAEGGTCDTYEAVLLALHELGGATPVDWTKLRRALQGILKEVPQQHEVTRALEKMDEIAKAREGEPVIDYLNGELHLVDPFFRYYVKWNTSIQDEAGE